MYVVAVPVYKDSKICGHDDTPFFANKTPWMFAWLVQHLLS
jgi:hypothetical protein